MAAPGEERLRIFLIGTWRIETGDGREIVISSARGRAIIAYLCFAERGRATRLEIAQTLWAEGRKRKQSCRVDDTEHRDDRLTNLREEIKKLRAIGKDLADVLYIDRDTLGIDLAHVWIDAEAKLLAMLDGDAPAQVPRREDDSLLKSFRDLTPAFSSWRDEQRFIYLDRKQAALAERAAQASADLLPLEEQRAAYQKLFNSDPSNEANCRALLSLLIKSGSFAVAAQTYQRCTTAIAVDIDATPEFETVALGEEIQRRLAGATEPGQRLPRPSLIVGPSSSSGSGSGQQPRSDRRNDQSMVVGVRPILNNTSDPALATVSDVIYDDLVTDLAMFARPFSIVELPPAGLASGQLEKSCGFIVDITLQQREGGCVATPCTHFNFRVREQHSGRVARGNRAMLSNLDFSGDWGEITNRIAHRIAHTLITSVIEDLERLPADRLSDKQFVAQGMYRLRHANTRPSMDAAEAHFLAALVRNPRSIEALVGLAHVYHRRATQPGFSDSPRTAMQRGRHYINDALNLDQLNPQALYVSAMLSSAEGQAANADLSFQRLAGITVSRPALGYQAYNGLFLGRVRAGRDVLKATVARLQDDPSIPIWHTFEAISDFLAGDITSAVSALDRSLALNPTYDCAKLWRAGLLQASGQTRAATQQLDAFRASNGTVTLAEFEGTWGPGRSSDADYLSRSRVMVGALRELGIS